MYTAMAVVALTLNVTSGTLSPTPVWLDSYHAAQARVADAGKPMVVVISSGQAGWTNVIRDGGLDPVVAKLLADKFVCLYVDTKTTEGRSLANAFQVGDRGVVISDRTGATQAFSASGTLSRTELADALVRYADEKVVTQTQTIVQTTPTQGTVTPAGGPVMAGTVIPAGGPVPAGTVVPAGHPVQTAVPAGGCGTVGYGYTAGGCGQNYASGCCGKGFGFGCGGGKGWGGGGCCFLGCGGHHGGYAASSCGQPMMAHAPVAVAPAQPCAAPVYHGGHGKSGCCFFGGGHKSGCGFGGGWGGGCGKGFGFGGGGCGFGGGWGGGCCK